MAIDFIASRTDGISQLDVLFAAIQDGTLIINEVVTGSNYYVSDPTSSNVLEDIT
jgi:hypothetical protein